MIVAINNDGKIYPPCGRCREMMYQVNKLNLDAKIILSDTKTVRLRFLLPMPWQDVL
jgi:cytidine deaminase